MADSDANLDKEKQRFRQPATPKKALYQETTDHLTREGRVLLREVDRSNTKRAAEKAEGDGIPPSDAARTETGDEK